MMVIRHTVKWFDFFVPLILWGACLDAMPKQSSPEIVMLTVFMLIWNGVRWVDKYSN